jgi:zinc protease
VSAVTAAPLVQHALDNGLRVVVRENHAAPAVAVNLWYEVGSRHEEPGRTGLAHLFEHLMFEGSRNVGSGEHFALLEPLGAGLNASTSFDRTNYYETVPSGALDLALWLEADRMGGLLDALDLPSLDNQRDVVKNERRQSYDNRPYGTAWERLFALGFADPHPYHHMPIGSMDDLDAASLDDVRAFFSRHYGPDNAVLTIVGDVTAEAALAAAARWFDPLAPIGAAAPPPAVAPTPITSALLDEVREDVPASASYLLWQLPADPDPVCDAAALAIRIVADGPSSRLQNRLVRREERAQAVGGEVERLVGGASAGIVIVRARDGIESAALEDAVAEEFARLAATGPTPRELAQALALITREQLEQTASFGGAADELSHYASLFGDPVLADTVVDRLAAVTPEQIAAVAARFAPS